MQNIAVPCIIRRRGRAYAYSGQCDCACAAEIVTEMPKGSDLSFSTLLQRSPGLHTQALSPEYYLVFLPSGSGDGIAVLNTAAWQILSYYEKPHSFSYFPSTWHNWGGSLVENILAALLDLRFLEAQSMPQTLPKQTTDIITTWLTVTNRCNLRCSYCYIPHKNTDMSPSIGRAAIDATFRAASVHGHHKIKLKYAGGEPLLRFPFIEELHHHAQSLARQNGTILDEVILSNGTLLTRKICKSIQKLGMRLMISLDGLGTYHDQQRHFPDGSGSFDEVSRAVGNALEVGIIPDISITVSRRNVDGLADVIAWILERDLPFSLNFYRESSYSACHTDLKLEEEHLIEGMLSVYRVIESNLPRRSLLAALADHANLSMPHLHTCSAGQDYLVFDGRGCVAKCQMALDQYVTDCHDPDPLEKVRHSTVGLQNLSVDEKSGCRDCEWRYWCGGGCPLETYRVFGRYDVKSPNCSIYKTLYPEIIRLEGLRLLKYAEDDA